MNRILILFIGVLFFSCSESSNENSNTGKNSPSSPEAVAVGNFDWLLGSWKRNNEEVGKETFEVWEKKSKSEYIGLGFTLQNGDTIKQEKMKLIQLNKKWNLEVKVPEEAESIIFKMTKFGKTEFVCENPELDFPKEIKYWKNGDKINALVSGLMSESEMKILFEFERIEK